LKKMKYLSTVDYVFISHGHNELVMLPLPPFIV